MSRIVRASTVWVWPLPKEGEMVPDYPPALLGEDVDVTIEDGQESGDG